MKYIVSAMLLVVAAIHLLPVIGEALGFDTCSASRSQGLLNYYIPRPFNLLL